MARTGKFGNFYFDPEVFTGYISERDPINSLLISSGVVTPAPASVASALSSENNVTTIPFYIPFEGDALNYDGIENNVPQELEGKKMTAMAFRRMKAWKEKDFTHELTGANDLSNVARKIGDYQAKQNQKTLLKILGALEGVAEFSTHVNSIARADLGDVQPTHKLGMDNAIKAIQGSLGDHFDELKVWFMHSAVYADLVRQGAANDVNIKAGAIVTDPFSRSFLGKPVVIDDTMTVVANDTTGLNEYHTYLCGTGLVMTAPVRIDTPNYVDYDPETAGGVQKLYSKWGRLLHPYGFSFDVASIAKESPTDAELGTSDNWSMVYDTKNIPLVAFISNVSA